MAIAGPAQETAAPAVRPPRAATLWAVGLAGWAAAGAAVALALTSDHVSEPGVQALLTEWAVLGYVLAGTIAWWRRPENRFGPLMIGVGFAFFLTSLTWSNAAVPYTIGIAFDLLPPRSTCTCSSRSPAAGWNGGSSGRSWRRRTPPRAACQLVGHGPRRLRARQRCSPFVSEPDAAYTLLRVQLSVLSGLALTGIVVVCAAPGPAAAAALGRAAGRLVRARAGDGRVPVHDGRVRWAQRPDRVRDDPARDVVRGRARADRVPGTALLDARLARSAVGELFVELRGNPAPAELRAALARALRDPSLTLAYWLPEFESWADVDGRPVELAERRRPAGRRRWSTATARGRGADPRPVAARRARSCSTR